MIDLDVFGFTFEYCCSILYLCAKKLNENKFINEKSYFKILKKSIKNGYRESNWSVILIGYLFKIHFMEVVINKNEYFNNDFDLIQKFVLLEILNKNLRLITSKNELKILTDFYERL